MEATVESAIAGICPEAASRFGVELAPAAREQLSAFASELLKWNRKFNLTSITSPGEVAELHILDSLALAPELAGSSVLDVGTGGGFPGVPLAIACPDLDFTLVDRTEKKVLFLKTTLARLGIRNARALHRRVDGDPAREGIEPVDVAVSRAFTAPGPWLELARAYVKPGGRIVAMTGAADPDLEPYRIRFGLAAGELVRRRYTLPSGAARGLVVVRRNQVQAPEGGP